MPNKDGTGPQGRSRMPGGNRHTPNGKGLGGVGKCTCPECGHKESHKRGIPCTTQTCPKCGAKMKGDNCL